ncbi:amidoligase family protein [Micromonospora inositola]|uniref:Putative amidoligase enzyme n=1 Tax=Micromonospora inositola TaxID=47865 RepID=A0A1C5K4Y9_9ACTN|nr:amidoligase family protein [Micromonospora inositola]SCG77822.1 Putative amidoligase enzyme [Micromonospora inositola]
MLSERFGVEVELAGLSLDAAREAVHTRLAGGYDRLGRVWRVELDGSVPDGFELISPPLHFDDLPLLQEIFRRLRQAGAHSASGAGVHVHVDAGTLSAAQITSLINLYSSHSRLLLQMLDVDSGRRLLYCQPIERFAETLATRKPTTMEQLKHIWYQVADALDEEVTRFNSSRYTELNLNSLFVRNTVEFRAFRSTNHAGKLKSFAILALAFVAHARSYAGVYPLQPVVIADETSARQAAADLFELLGLSGSDFKNTRQHFLSAIAQHHHRRSERGSSRLSFAALGMSFEGGSYADLLDEIWDSGFFNNGQLDDFLTRIRKRRWSLTEKPWIAQTSMPVDDYDRYSKRVLQLFERYGIGQITYETPEASATAP